MSTRTTQATISFASAFMLPGFDDEQPSGEYLVEYDEERLDAGAHVAWHRVLAFIHLPAIGSRSQTRQMVPIATAELQAVIDKDKS